MPNASGITRLAPRANFSPPLPRGVGYDFVVWSTATRPMQDTAGKKPLYEAKSNILFDKAFVNADKRIQE